MITTEKPILGIAPAAVQPRWDALLHQTATPLHFIAADEAPQLTAALNMPERWALIFCDDRVYLDGDLAPRLAAVTAPLVILKARERSFSWARVQERGIADVVDDDDAAHLAAVIARELRRSAHTAQLAFAAVDYIGLRARQTAGTAARPTDELTRARIKTLMDAGGLVLQFQPIVALNPREPQHNMFEVLLRLRDERGELLLPGEFLPVVAEAGWMPKLDVWIVHKTIATLREMQTVGARESMLFINLAPQTLAAPEALTQIGAAIAAAPLSPGSLVIELGRVGLGTASTGLETLTAALRAGRHGLLIETTDCAECERLAAAYPDTLRYLKLGPRAIRAELDGAFTPTAPQRVIACAKAAGMQVIALAIDDAAVLPKLVALGVDAIQGYFAGMPYEELIYPVLYRL